MAYPAVIDFKRLSDRRRKFARRSYTMEQAIEKVQNALSEGADLKNLNELKNLCLADERARKELTNAIRNTLVDEAIMVENESDVQKAAELLFADMYGWSIFQKYMDDPAYNECYFNGPSDCWVIEGLERKPILEKFRSEEHAISFLKRLTENSREGKAADDNKINSTVLPGRTRLRWMLPPVSESTSANIRKHTMEDMLSITPEKYIEDGTMTRPVLSLLAGMAITGVCYGILGPGGIGKTALLRVILKEAHERLFPRFLISENGAELNLKEYLFVHGCLRIDVQSAQKWSGDKEGLKDIFASFMQAKGEYLIQPEVLYPDEVDNILMASRRGHVMGPFTFHSYPHKFIDSLTDLYLQSYQSSRDSVKHMLLDDVQASCYYDVEYENGTKQRRIFGVYEYLKGERARPILEYDQTEQTYTMQKIKNPELRDKLRTLRHIDRELYEEVSEFL